MTAVIQSIQQTSITLAAGQTTVNGSIASVVTANAFILWQGVNVAETSSTGYKDAACTLQLTGATTVQAVRGASANAMTVNFTVIEFSGHVNSIQQAIINIATTSASATLGTAVGANAFVVYLGQSTALASETFNQLAATVAITSSTQVTATCGVSGAQSVAFMVVDLDSTIINTVQARAFTDTSANPSYIDTISSVTQGNTLLIWNGQQATGNNAIGTAHTIQLTSATQVTMTRQGANTGSRTICYTVVQFQSAVLNSSVQRNTITLASQASNTAAVSPSVNPSYALANYCGFNFSGTATPNIINPTVALTGSGSTVTAALNAAGTVVASYEVLEFVATGGNTETLSGASVIGNFTSSGSLVAGRSLTGADTIAAFVSSGSMVAGRVLSSAVTIPNFISNGTLTDNTKTLSGASLIDRFTSNGTLQDIKPGPGVIPHDDYDRCPWWLTGGRAAARELALAKAREEIGLLPRQAQASQTAAAAVDKAVVRILETPTVYQSEERSLDLVQSYAETYRKAFRRIYAKARAEDAEESFKTNVKRKLLEKSDEDMLMMVAAWL